MLRLLALALIGLSLSSCASIVGPKFSIVTESGNSIDDFGNFYDRSKKRPQYDFFLGGKAQWEYE